MSLEFKGGPKVGAGIGFNGGPKVGKGAPDPLAGVNYTGNIEADSAQELTAMEQAYRDRARAEADRFTAATDSEFWFAVCFTSRDEKEDFLREFGAARLGDKYLDGRALARRLRTWAGGEST